MFNEAKTCRDFDLAFQGLQAQKQEIVKRKINLLIQNPQHRSLEVHQLHRLGEHIWDCYITQGPGCLRLLYEIQGRSLLLWQLGGHEIVDHAHWFRFDRSTPFSPWQYQTPTVAVPDVPQQSPAVRPYQDAQTYAQKPQPGENYAQERNYFSYFRAAHLRILGVPDAQIQAVKEAETLAEVFDLPGLPAQALDHLMDLVTSKDMKTVLLDSSQLLYRTRLDRLEGYFEGRIKKLMLNLEEEQQQYVDMKHVPLLLLKGTAGCGKTTIGIYRAIRLAGEGRRVLVVTYNRTLAKATKTLIEELSGPLPANLEVKTASSVMGSLLGARLTIPNGKQAYLPRQFLQEALAEVRLTETAQVLARPEAFFSEEIQGVIKGLDLVNVEAYKAIKRYGRKTALGPVQREAVWKVYEAYQKRMEAARIHEWSDAALLVLEQAKSGPLGKSYDDIIVDEAQDLKPVDLRVIQALVAPQGTLMVLGDAAQTLYSRGFSWAQAGISARGRTSILRINYRNTSQIAETASQLIVNNTLMRSSNEFVDAQWTRRDGPRPMLLYATAKHTQADLICEQILELLSKERCRPADIAVLSPDNRSCEICKNILLGKGLRVSQHTDADFDILEEQIKVITIHSAKGLEYPVVFLLGLIEGDLPRSTRALQDEEEAQLEIERARMLCYVGMTRAAEMLYLVTVRGQESRFIHELVGKIEVSPAVH